MSEQRTEPASLDAAPAASAAARPPVPPGTQPVTRMRRWGGAAGIAGPILLVIYFATPALVGWPYAGATPDHLIAFATGHALLFYAGGWLQVTGALLSVLFFLVLLQLSGARDRLAGAATLTGAALLLAVVTIEAALLEAVPMAAAAGDRATVATTFALSNGVFARIFPLAPAPLLFAGIGMALRGAAVLRPVFSRSALIVAGLFVLAGVTAVFGTPGLIFAIAMSVVEAIWIAIAAIALVRSSSARTGAPPSA
ncbi:hypothetical protein [Pseudonocardia acidicola]|uniref:DUF4386 family protein n=1 Tax=Pseudonocardia acidicola TaxID=2724939 RepID=A0ABX1S4U7_9PSEU|nr:hypothetical protein [Pseudonocardia acidicola]NMH96551.1 hypothetical protein [Pseudonocardia acidicola]